MAEMHITDGGRVVHMHVNGRVLCGAVHSCATRLLPAWASERFVKPSSLFFCSGLSSGEEWRGEYISQISGQRCPVFR